MMIGNLLIYRTAMGRYASPRSRKAARLHLLEIFIS
jgi:hypothetical protein